MTTFSGIFDTKAIISETSNSDITTGYFSKYITQNHPGTNNLITGWQWDKRLWPGEDTDYNTFVPILTNVDLSGISDDNFQSGTGTRDECEVLDINLISKSGITEYWAPSVNHGYFYDFDDKRYLYSDGARTQYITTSGLTVSGYNAIDLYEFPKPGIPISGKTYIWDKIHSKYDIYRNYRQLLYFTGYKPDVTSSRLSTYNPTTQTILWDNIDTTKSEFIVINNNSQPPSLAFNNTYTTEIGNAVSVGTDLLSLEEVGESDGSNNQQYHTLYSPIEPNAILEIFTYTTTSSYQQWTIVDKFTHTGYEVMVDRDLGIIVFGVGTSGDNIPLAGNKVVVRYTRSVEIVYEPLNTTNEVLAINESANTNPIRRLSNHGFILIKNAESQPYSVILSADLDEISDNFYGPLNIGNNFTGIKAQVKSSNGELLDDVNVTFNILDNPSIGKFANGLDSILGITNDLGESVVFYNPPRNINEIGELINDTGFTIDGTNTILTTSNIKITGSQSDIFLFKVWKDDPILGIPLGEQTDLDAGIITSGLDEFYRQYFVDESIYGPTGLVHGTTTATGSPLSLQSGASWWENRHRIVMGLLTPTNYNRSLRNGRKQLVSYFNESAIDPHITLSGAFVPLQPTRVENIASTQNDVIFSGVVLDTPETGDLDSYLLISPTTVQMQATVVNTVTNTIIYSNIIQVKLTIPSFMNGLVNIDNINAVPSGIVPYMLTSEHNGRILPLGFRLKSPGITLASALAGVTFIDINQQPILSNVFNVQIKG